MKKEKTLNDYLEKYSRIKSCAFKNRTLCDPFFSPFKIFNGISVRRRVFFFCRVKEMTKKGISY